MSVPIRRLEDLAETYVFGKQSDGPILCGLRRLPSQGGSPAEAPLLPKLRGHFAEFLNHGSLERLRFLTSPTCGGLRYGQREYSRRGFSWQRGTGHFVSKALVFASQG